MAVRAAEVGAAVRSAEVGAAPRAINHMTVPRSKLPADVPQLYYTRAPSSILFAATVFWSAAARHRFGFFSASYSTTAPYLLTSLRDFRLTNVHGNVIEEIIA